MPLFIRALLYLVDDIKHLSSHADNMESLHLDYEDTPFNNPNDGYAEIVFKANDDVIRDNLINIPYAQKLDRLSKFKDSAPATGNGFLSSRNGDVIPEWTMPDSEPLEGVIVWVNKNGEKSQPLAKWNEKGYQVTEEGQAFLEQYKKGK